MILLNFVSDFYINRLLRSETHKAVSSSKSIGCFEETRFWSFGFEADVGLGANPQ